MYKTYKVIKESYWTDSKGKANNFHVFVRANSTEEATKYSVQKWGLDNIKEVIPQPPQPLNLNNFVQMVRDDMMAGAAPDEYPTDEKVRTRAKSYYNSYLQGVDVDDLF